VSHHWTFYAFASPESGAAAGAAAGAGPPVVGLGRWEMFISTSYK